MPPARYSAQVTAFNFNTSSIRVVHLEGNVSAFGQHLIIAGGENAIPASAVA